MALTIQNLRAVGNNISPGSLLPGQIAFNVTDKVIYVGDGSSTRKNFDGTAEPGVPGEGWYVMPMDFDTLGEYFVPNPAYWSDIPTDQQVLTWDEDLGHPVWGSGGSGGGGQVYVVTNNDVALAPGATTSAKITAALGISPDEGNVTIVTGLPDDVYEGLYFFTTDWVKGAAYAYPSATEVIYDNTVHTNLGPTVQLAIDDLDDGLTATTAIANTANSTANSALSIANAAIPRASFSGCGQLLVGNGTGLFTALNPGAADYILQSNGDGTLAWVSNAKGDVTGVTGTSPITVDNTNPQTPIVGINAATTSAPGAVQLSNSLSSTSITEASTPFATKAVNDAAIAAQATADAAIPRASYTTQGDLLVGTGAGIFGPLAVGTQGQILVVGPGGSVQWEDDAPGDVTSVAATAPITVDNTDPEVPVIGVNLATTATPGVVQVELTGNLTLLGGVINVPDASTTVKGAVQLNNTLGSSSTTEALTAAQGAALQNQIDALTLSNSVILAGGYDASTGLVDGVTSQGTLAGFADGVAPPAAAAGNVDHYLICVVAGSNPSAMQNGDWLLSVETSPGVYAYQVLGVGARPDSATYIQAGIVQLANAAAVLAGTSDTLAITPQALQDNVLDSVTTANSSQIASSTAVKTAYDAGVQGQTDAAAALAVANAALPKAGGTMTGTINAHNVNIENTYSLQFAGGTNGSLNAVTDLTNVTSSTTAASATAVKAASDAAAAAQATADAALPKAGGTMTGNITFQDPGEGVVFNGGSSVYAISDSTSTTSSTTAASATAAKTAYDAGIQGQTDAAAAQATADAAVPKSCYTALGALAAGTGASTVGTLALGTSGQFLAANSACGTGLEWCTLSLACIPCSAYTAVGTILAGNGAGTYCSLPVGSNGQVLVPNSACAAGVEWVTRTSLNICGFTCSLTPFSTVIGSGAGAALTSNSVANTAIGYNALDVEASGDFNTAVGHNALTAQNGASGNTALGANAGAAITNGLNNTLVGCGAGDALTSAQSNVAVGQNALGAATASFNNVVIGQCAMANATATAGSTIAIGLGALAGLTSGGGNIAIGTSAGASMTGGGANTIVGNFAGDAITTGGFNTIIGCGALGTATTASGNTAIGSTALASTTGASNTAIGNAAGTGITTGACNTVIGANAGTGITTGGCNTLIGGYAGTTTLSNNVVLSDGAGTIKLQVNENGAVGVGTTPSFGTAGQVLASQGSGAASVWCTLSLACIPCSAFTAAGQLLVGTGTSTFTALPVGTNGQVLVPNSSCAAGVEWITTGALCIQGYTCTAAPFNTALGALAGDSITSGDTNTMVGYQAGTSVTSTNSNTLIGWAAGACGSTLQNVVAIGYGAMQCATPLGVNTGHVAVGTYALQRLTSGLCNVAVGLCALCSLTTGGCNTAIGHNSLDAAIGGAGNTAVGAQSLGAVTSGDWNTAVGFNAGLAVTTATCNTTVGYLAGCSLTTNGFNTFLGAGAGRLQTSTNNTAVGACALANTGVNNNTAVGFSAGAALTTGGSNTFVGAAAGDNATTADNAVAVGYNALGAAHTVAGTVAIGANALAAATSGVGNVAVGLNAGQALTTGGCNVAVGHNALCASNACGLVAVGFQAAQTSTTGVVTAVGHCALRSNTTGTRNTAVGYNAGLSIIGGSDNTLIGDLSGDVLTGSNNTFVGSSAGGAATVGNDNTFIGKSAGTSVTTGFANVLIGGYAGTTTLSNNVVLSDGAGTIRFQSNSSGAISLGAGGAYGTAGQVLTSGGSAAAPTWTTLSVPTSYTDTFATTSATPINLLSFSGAVRMGTLTVMLTDNATNVAWANVTIAADTGVGSSVVTTSGGTFGTFDVVNNAGATVVQFTPSATLATVSASYKYTASFGSEPTVL